MKDVIKAGYDAGLTAKDIADKNGFNLKSVQCTMSKLRTGHISSHKATPQTPSVTAAAPTKHDYISRNIYGTTDVKLMTEAYKNRDNVLIIGETGSGKTHLVRYVAKTMNVPYMRVNMNGGWTPEDFAGQYVPNPNPGLDEPKYLWQDGRLVEFMKNGGIFVVDEINMAPADILSMLHSVTDDERQIVITQNKGEIVTAHPNFWFVATMNPDYEGTKPLNLALKDRFRIIVLGYNDKVEKKLGIDDKFLDLTKKLRDSSEITTPVSTRDLIKYRDDKGKYGEDVARAFFINNFDINEQPVVKEMIEMILDGKEIVNSSSNQNI
jgi:MoxR-like ATPase